MANRFSRWLVLTLPVLTGLVVLPAIQTVRAQQITPVLAVLPNPLPQGDNETGLPPDSPQLSDNSPNLDNPVPLVKIHPRHREAVEAVMNRPALTCSGPVETFLAKPNFYNWLLDHPDSTAILWQRLGAKCLPIQALGEQSYRWRDPDHGQITWTMVLKENDMRVWYATGKVRPALLLPQAPVEAVLVARYITGKTSQDRPAIRHQYQLYLRTDSRATAMAARFLGASLPRLAEQYMGQVQLFFHGMAWMHEEQPRRAARLVEGVVPPEVLRPVVEINTPAKTAGLSSVMPGDDPSFAPSDMSK